MEKKLASNQLEDFNEKLKKSINDSLMNVNLDSNIRNALKQNITLITNEEKKYLEESSEYFMIVFGLTCVGLFLAVYVYYLICKNTFHVNINWYPILIPLFFIIVCIIGFEIVYFIYILLNKKINNKKIIKYFIDNAMDMNMMKK